MSPFPVNIGPLIFPSFENGSKPVQPCSTMFNPFTGDLQGAASKAPTGTPRFGGVRGPRVSRGWVASL